MAEVDSIPLVVFFAGTVIVSVLGIEAGFSLGKWRRNLRKNESDAPLGVIIGSTLGLLAFMLGFTFNIAATRFDDRRLAVLNEANVIGTAYLRADFLEQPERDHVKKLFREYVGLRAKAGASSLDVLKNKSLFLQNQLWKESVLLAPKYSNSTTYALFISSLNDAIDMHEVRMAAGVYARVPLVIWLSLFVVALLSMVGVGYSWGITGSRSLVSSVILSLCFGVVLWLVADLDRPNSGAIRTSQRPMIDLQQSLGPP